MYIGKLQNKASSGLDFKLLIHNWILIFSHQNLGVMFKEKIESHLFFSLLMKLLKEKRVLYMYIRGILLSHSISSFKKKKKMNAYLADLCW